MLKKTRLSAALALGAAAILALTACTSGGGETENTAEPAPETGLSTLTEGKLTIATGEPAFEPWVVGDDPASGEGFEAAVAYAVAEQLGFADEDVEWVRTTFDAAIAPGPKDFDLNLQQFSVTEERAEVVDFSSPYYETTQAVVAATGTEAAEAAGIADLKSATLGVMSGTTSLKAAEDVIAPDTDVQVFNDNADAVTALQNGQIDALVVDLPTAFYVRDAQLEGDGVIVGQLDAAAGDEFAFVLPKDSALTADVSAAVDALRADGTLEQLEQTWLADQGAPFLS
ncbi:amino acid ABC transporter substrate-binding protein [Leucobacter weissii]|uniref:Amino acid ABC transporter substrate-binding protein n=1 Tax=Leucobacter weissii TaxID=1983706 RepID=A0A939SAW0_9MICO|nr:amino acid ABC transporter substrate-binding protein [Leucobacter weissii]